GVLLDLLEPVLALAALVFVKGHCPDFLLSTRQCGAGCGARTAAATRASLRSVLRAAARGAARAARFHWRGAHRGTRAASSPIRLLSYSLRAASAPSACLR